MADFSPPQTPFVRSLEAIAAIENPYIAERLGSVFF